MKKLMIAFVVAAFTLTACKKKNPQTFHSQPTASQSVSNTDLQYKLEWTGFKTPAKKGVKGTFTNIKLDNVNSVGTAATDELAGANFTIITSSVSSGDAKRDQNINNFLFKKMAGQNITGTFGKFTANQVPIQITMNNVTKKIPFNFEQKGDTLVVKGTVDIVKDFSATGALASFAEACKVMHEGKTWSDVNITAKFYK